MFRQTILLTSSLSFTKNGRLKRSLLLFSTYCLKTLKNYQISAFTNSLTRRKMFHCFSTSSTSFKAIESQEEIQADDVNVAEGKDLAFVHALLEKIVPRFMVHHCFELTHVLATDVAFEDFVYDYRTKGVREFMKHTLKVRSYFHFKSPYKKIQLLGSYIRDDKVVIIWRLKIMRMNLLSYFTTSFIRKDLIDVTEGAVEFYVGSSGKIYKIINRKVSEEDTLAAEEFAAVKAEAEKLKKQNL